MRRMMEEEYLELTDELRNSIEIGQTSKGDWYCRQIKLYFSNSEEDRLSIIGQIFSLRDRVAVQLKGVNNE